jgi:hypothetical protein
MIAIEADDLHVLPDFVHRHAFLASPRFALMSAAASDHSLKS